MKYRKNPLCTTSSLFIAAVFGGASMLWLQKQPRDKDKVAFVFAEFQISRWKYLNKLRGRLLIDQVLQTVPNTEYVDPPEPNRPPFDRVPYPYEVRYNNMGFRDQDFTLEEPNAFWLWVTLWHMEKESKRISVSLMFWHKREPILILESGSSRLHCRMYEQDRSRRCFPILS